MSVGDTRQQQGLQQDASLGHLDQKVWSAAPVGPLQQYLHSIGGVEQTDRSQEYQKKLLLYWWQSQTWARLSHNAYHLLAGNVVLWAGVLLWFGVPSSWGWVHFGVAVLGGLVLGGSVWLWQHMASKRALYQLWQLRALFPTEYSAGKERLGPVKGGWCILYYWQLKLRQRARLVAQKDDEHQALYHVVRYMQHVQKKAHVPFRKMVQTLDIDMDTKDQPQWEQAANASYARWEAQCMHNAMQNDRPEEQQEDQRKSRARRL